MCRGGLPSSSLNMAAASDGDGSPRPSKGLYLAAFPPPTQAKRRLSDATRVALERGLKASPDPAEKRGKTDTSPTVAAGARIRFRGKRSASFPADAPEAVRPRLAASSSGLESGSLPPPPPPKALSALRRSSSSAAFAGDNESVITNSSANSGTLAQGRKFCRGCRRCTAVDRAFVLSADENGKEAAQVRWFYRDMRADWCHECFSVYRSVYKPPPLSMNPAVFETFMSVEENHRVFVGRLIASTFLRFSGYHQIRKENILETEERLQKIFAFMGIPWPCFDALLIEPGMAAPGPGACLIPLMSGSGGPPAMSHVALVPSGVGGMRRTDGRRVLSSSLSLTPWILRPVVDASTAFREWFDTLPAPDRVDVSCSVDASEVQAASAAGGSPPQRSVDPAERNFMVKVHSATESSQTILCFFLGEVNAEAHSRLREKDIQGPINKMNALKDDLIESPFATLANELEEPMVAVKALRKIVKPLKGYTTNLKVEPLVGVKDELKTCAGYIKKVKGVQALSSRVVFAVFKINFTDAATVGEKISLLREYLGSEKVPNGEAFLPCNTFIDVASGEMSKRFMLEVQSDDNNEFKLCEEMAAALLKEGRAVKSPTSKMNDFIAVLTSCETLAHVAVTQEATQASVRDALSCIDTNATGLRVKIAFEKGEVGRAIRNEAENYLRDCDMKLDLTETWTEGLTLIFAEGMPQDDPDDGDAVLVDKSMFRRTSYNALAAVNQVEEMIEVTAPMFSSGDAAQTLLSLMDSVIDALVQMKVTFAAADAVTSQDFDETCRAIYTTLIQPMDALVASGTDGARQSWPPALKITDLSDDKIDLDEEKENDDGRVADEVDHFLERVLEPMAESHVSLLEAVTGLRTAISDCGRNRDARKQMKKQMKKLIAIIEQHPEASDADAEWALFADGQGFFRDIARLLQEEGKFEILILVLECAEKALPRSSGCIDAAHGHHRGFVRCSHQAVERFENCDDFLQ